jgi:RNA polymerase sigma factor (sigma-70 family)
MIQLLDVRNKLWSGNGSDGNSRGQEIQELDIFEVGVIDFNTSSHMFKEWAIVANKTEHDLHVTLLRGLYAKNAIIANSMLMVHGMVSKYCRDRSKKREVSHDGTRGVRRAMVKFNITLGYRFRTYAKHWVQAFIIQGFKQRQAASMGVSLSEYELIIASKKCESSLRGELNRDPTSQEVARRLGVKHHKLTKTIDSPVKMRSGSIKAFRSHKSDESEVTIGDQAADMYFIHEEAEEEAKKPIRMMQKVLRENLSPRELEILKMRQTFPYLPDNIKLKDGKSNYAVARALNISPEGVRLLEMRALNKLRAPFRAHSLMDQIDNNLFESNNNMIGKTSIGVSRYPVASI